MKTWEIATQVPIMSINDYVELDYEEAVKRKSVRVNSFKELFQGLLTMDLENREVSILENLYSIKLDTDVPEWYKHFKIGDMNWNYFYATKRNWSRSITW